MTDTTVTPYPTTPAEVAAAVLDAIERWPEAFDMYSWVEFGSDDDPSLTAGADPACGTTMCAAGWAAHVTGWTLVVVDDDAELVEITVPLPGGGTGPGWASIYAEKNGERREIAHVAAEALGLGWTEGFWYVDESTALARLREIAGR